MDNVWICVVSPSKWRHVDIWTLERYWTNTCISCADPEGGRVSGPNHKNKGFLSNTDLDPLKTYDHKATKPALNVGPSSAPFKWRFHYNDVTIIN